MPEVSIITPNYNSEKYLADTVQSVLNQTFEDWEWIIVDDGSTDQSLDYLQSIQDKRIKILKTPKNSGAAVARNLALEEAQARFITFLDSDDLWKPTFLEKTRTYLLEEEETVVYTSYERVDENLKPKLRDFKAIDKITYQRILFNCPIPMLTAMYDTQKIGKVMIPIVEKREDHAMWIEILKRTKHARAINESLGIYRIREGSYSRNKRKLIIYQFFLYSQFLKLPLHKSVFYTITWGINGIIKYV